MSIFTTLLVAASTIMPACDIAEDVDIVGMAYNIKTEELVYCELHSVSAGANTTTVKYVDLANQIIAEKFINFNGDKVRPTVRQKDLRHGEERQVIETDGLFTLRYKKSENSQWREKSLPAHKIDVIDAGFDALIRRDWDTLVSGEIQKFNFASAPHLTKLHLQVARKKPEQCVRYTPALQQKAIDNTVCFWVQISNGILKLFTRPLKLTYDGDSKRLLVFNGVVNILDANAKSQSVSLMYYYPQ